MVAHDPIPPNLVQAFRTAIVQLNDWAWGGEEPLVSLEGKGNLKISAIAELASIFSDPMPEDICVLLDEKLHWLGGDLPAEQLTFLSGGKYLRQSYSELVSRREKRP